MNETAPRVKDMLCRSPDEIVPMGPDWSSLMTETLNSLQKAEEELRMLHTSDVRKSKARSHLWKAQALLLQLDEWCKEKV